MARGRRRGGRRGERESKVGYEGGKELKGKGKGGEEWGRYEE